MVNRVQWVQRAEEEKKKEMMYIVQQVQRADEEEEKKKECIWFGELRRCRRRRCFTECNRSGFCCTGWIYHI